MSVESRSKPRPAICRLPLSNLTNIPHPPPLSKSHHPTPSPYSSRPLHLTKSKQFLKPPKPIPPKPYQTKYPKPQPKPTKLKKQPLTTIYTSQTKKPSQNEGKLKDVLEQLRTQVGLLHSKSMSMEQMHKELTSQVKQLRDTCKVSKFMKDQTSKKMKVLDGLSRENEKRLKEMLKESTKRKSKSTIDY